MSAFLAALLTMAGGASAQTGFKQGKAYGVLLLSPEGGKAWSQAISAIAKALGKDVPLADAPAPDVKAMQRAVAALEARKVQKIIAVPLFLSSYSAEMDQIRYLLGIRKDPSGDYLGFAHRHEGETNIKRVKFKEPVVLSAALDDHALFSDVLAARVAKKSKNPSRETLVVVADAPASDEKNSQWLGALNSLAEMARRKAQIAQVRTVLLPKDAAQPDRDKAMTDFLRLIRTLKAQGPVIVAPLALTSSDLPRDISKALVSAFVQYDGIPLLPDSRLSAWVVESAQRDSGLPDMRNFKDDGRPRPKANPFRRLGGRP